MTDALAYLRTSSATNTGDDKDTHLRQMVAIQRYADVAGLSIVLPPFYDAAVSGVDLIETRPGFTQMLAYIDSSDVRIVLVEDESRFARDLMTQELGLRMLIARGVKLITASGTVLTDDSDPMNVLRRQMVGAMCQYDKARIVARLKGARDRKSEAAGKRVEGKKADLALVAAAKALKASEPSLSRRELAVRLGDMGYVTKSGKPLSHSHVGYLLAHD